MCIGNAPKPRQFHASAVYKNYIFIIGGFAAANYNEMYMFDTGNKFFFVFLFYF